MSKQTWIIIGALVAVVLIFSVRDNGSGANASSTQPCQFTVNADILNVRQDPTTDAPIVGTFQQNAKTGAEKTVSHGFRQIGPHKWVANRFLEPASGSSC